MKRHDGRNRRGPKQGGDNQRVSTAGSDRSSRIYLSAWPWEMPTSRRMDFWAVEESGSSVGVKLSKLENAWTDVVVRLECLARSALLCVYVKKLVMVTSGVKYETLT